MCLRSLIYYQSPRVSIDPCGGLRFNHLLNNAKKDGLLSQIGIIIPFQYRRQLPLAGSAV